jgi:hypothetical protein
MKVRVLKSSHPSIGKGCMGEDLPFQREVTLEKLIIRVGRTPEQPGDKVYMSHPSQRDRCQRIPHFVGRTVQRKVNKGLLA